MSLGVIVGPAQRESFSEATQTWSSRLVNRIERRPVRAFLCLTAFYAVAVLLLSSFKLLWLDELITLHIARLGSIAAIWHALEHGADPNPPLTHILVHFCRVVFGEREFALRLPAMAGYWVGLLSLFLFLRRFVPATWALGGTVVSMAMAAFEYSYESRSYGIFYGLTMLAVFCWSRGVDPELAPGQCRLWLTGMTLALAAGISTNYFAVLAFMPIAAGEFTRTLLIWRKQQQDNRHGTGAAGLRWSVSLQVWLGLIFAATPLILYRPLIEHSIAQFAPYAWNKVSLDQVIDSYTQMVEIVLYPILALFAFTLVVGGLGWLCDACRARLQPRWLGVVATHLRYRQRLVSAHETVAIAALMMFPVLGYVVASIRGGMLSPRFVIPVCLGFSIAATLVAYQLFGYMARAGLVLLCFATAWFVARESVVGYWYVEQKQCFYKILEHLPEAERAVSPGGPIAIPDPLLALSFQHYAPPAVAKRAVFPVDFPALRFYRHDDSPEENLWAGRESIYTLPVVLLAAFEHQAGTFLLIGTDDNWLVQDLRRHRYPVERLPINTRAGAIGGFTPLGHGVPSFFVSSGDTTLHEDLDQDPVIPFRTSANLPSARLTADQITSPDEKR